ncbi:MAG: hypothetical protein QOC82_2901 [Frankiaceae bacterium]|jgi:hypothetical protein|nr:hypothetical protein [Frankiaceae bacterium]
MMIRKITRLAVVMAAAATTFVSPPANAGSIDFFTLSGTGTISPGLTTTGGPQTWSYSGNGYGVVFGVAGPWSCSWNGNDTIGTTLQGAGGFSGTCNTLPGVVCTTGTYSRGAGVSISGSFTCGWLTGHIFYGTCAFSPTSGPVVTSYAFIWCRFEVD